MASRSDFTSKAQRYHEMSEKLKELLTMANAAVIAEEAAPDSDPEAVKKAREYQQKIKDMILELENTKPFPKSDEPQGLLELAEATFKLIKYFYRLVKMSNTVIEILRSIPAGSTTAMMAAVILLGKIAIEAFAICKDLLKSLKAWRKRRAEAAEKFAMLDIMVSEITVELDGYSATYIWVDKGEPSSSGGGGRDRAEDAPGNPPPSS